MERTIRHEEGKMDQLLRVYLVDDDLASFNLVLDVLDHAPWVQVVGGTSNPEVALREIHELAVDAIFLDVELRNGGASSCSSAFRSNPRS